MIRRFFIHTALRKAVLEQDVKVTVEEVRDVPVEVGDEVMVLMRAEVAHASAEEVELRNMQPVKIVSIKRAGAIP